MRLRPSSDKITIYRRVVSFWQRTMSKCMPDLQESDQKTVLEVITKGEGLDGAVIDAISGFPTVFHAGMIADLRSGDEEDYRRAQEDAVTKAENSLWEAKMLAFKTLLDRDVATIQRAAAGHLHLQDKSLDTKLFFSFLQRLSEASGCWSNFEVGLSSLCSHPRLDWIAHQKRISQVNMATSLVDAYNGWFNASVQCNSLSDIVADIAKLSAPVPPLVPPPSTSAFPPAGKRLAILKIDLNCPNVP